MAQVTQDVKGKIESAYVKDAPFDEAKKALEKDGYKIISLEENAQLRIQEGKNAYISQNGNYTREGVVYIPKKGIFLTKNSPIMKNAEKATQCHRNGNEFYINKEQIEKALDKKYSVKIDNRSIPVSEFGNEEITDFAFGKTAKEYGQFLKDAGIKEIPFYLASLEDKPFARQLWLCGLDSDGRSGFDGYDRSLNYDGGVRGVRDASAEGAKPQKILPYTMKDVRIAEKEIGKLSKILQPEQIANVKGLIEKLKQ